jgi:hypothetical protein
MRTADQVTIAALANMVRLLCAELTAGQHRDDVETVIGAVRAKLNVVVTDASPEILVEGLKRAHEALNPVLAQVRAQAAEARQKDMAVASDGARSDAPASKPLRLN